MRLQKTKHNTNQSHSCTNIHPILEVFSHPGDEKQDTDSDNSSEPSEAEGTSAHTHLFRKLRGTLTKLFGKSLF